MLVFFTISGDITQKGYEKKRAKLLSPYLSSQKTAGICAGYFAVAVVNFYYFLFEGCQYYF